MVGETVSVTFTLSFSTTGEPPKPPPVAVEILSVIVSVRDKVVGVGGNSRVASFGSECGGLYISSFGSACG